MLDKARKIASDYEIVMWFEDGEWYGRGLELPHTYGDGKTPAACIASVRQGLVVTVATMLEDGERPPVPARTGERTEQVNIRLTASEKVMLFGQIPNFEEIMTELESLMMLVSLECRKQGLPFPTSLESALAELLHGSIQSPAGRSCL